MGLQPQEFAPRLEDFSNYVHPGDLERVAALIQQAQQDHHPYRAEHRVVRPSGDVRFVRAQGKVSAESEDRMLGVLLDITEEHDLREALADSEEFHRVLMENAYDVIWTMALDGTITYVSPSVERVRGITPEEARAQGLEEIHPPESAARVAEYFARLFAAMAEGTELPEFHGEQEYYRKDGSIMLGELQVIPQVDAAGHVVRILGVTRDISDQRRYEDELNHLAVTDPLTGVWNRRQGERLLTADLSAARRYGPPLSLLLLDVDHFKAVNDTHGHHVGDVVLRELCQRLEANLRPSDALIRWGGEEFIILARHCALAAGVALADKVVALVGAAPFDGAGEVTVSVGVAALHPDDDLDSWLQRADRALYDAKDAGRNTARSRD